MSALFDVSKPRTGASLSSLIRPVPFTEAIGWAKKRRAVLPEEFYGRLQGAARVKAFTITGLSTLSQLKTVNESLVQALRTGETFREWQGRVKSGEIPLTLPRTRLETVFRTNVQVAYGHGRGVQQLEHARRRPFLMYDAINDSRTRPAHAAMDGYIAPVNDPIWKAWTPPAGFSCRCTLLSLTEDQARARGYPTPLPQGAQPDKGWDYDKLADVDDSLRQAADAAVRSTLGPLGDAAAKALAPPVGPAGPAVSKALELPPRSALKSVLNLIDEIHGDGKLPTIPVTMNAARNAYGTYSWTLGNRALNIKVSRHGDHQGLTLAHEVGHFLDHQGMGPPGYETHREGGVLSAVMKAIQDTNEVKQLAAQSGARVRNYTRIVLTRHELWARAYAQYIAVKSRDATLLADVQRIRTSGNPTYQLSQWSDESFAPVLDAMEAAFKTLGWTR